MFNNLKNLKDFFGISKFHCLASRDPAKPEELGIRNWVFSKTKPGFTPSLNFRRFSRIVYSYDAFKKHELQIVV